MNEEIGVGRRGKTVTIIDEEGSSCRFLAVALRGFYFLSLAPVCYSQGLG